METAPESTESTTEGLPLGLPDDVFNQVLEYLDGPALLVSCRVDRTWAKSTESCSAAWRGAAGAEDAADWNSARYLVWRARTAGIVVVELGATGDRVGLAWARAAMRRWRLARVHHFRQRRACEIAHRCLYQLPNMQGNRDGAPLSSVTDYPPHARNLYSLPNQERLERGTRPFLT